MPGILYKVPGSKVLNMDDPNQPVENPTANQNPPKNLGSQFLAITNAKWFLVGVVLLACAGLYAISASSRGLWPFPAPEEKVVLIPSSSATLTPTPNPTADWQTYRSEKYGFEFKYPKDYLLHDSTNTGGIPAHDIQIVLQKNGSEHIWIVRDYLGFENIQKAFERYFFIDINKVVTKEYKVNNYQILSGSFTAPVVSSTKAAIVSNGEVYVGFQTTFPEQEGEVLDQMISSFKFIPLTSSGPVPSTPLGTGEPDACIQVITPARNPQTGEVKDFPTPCDVPEGWEKI